MKKKKKEKKSLKFKKVHLIIIVAVIVTCTGGIVTYEYVSNNSNSIESQNSGMNSKNEKDANPMKASAGSLVSATGTVSAGSVYQSAELSGMVLVAEEIFVKAGDEVSQGDKLVKVTDDSLSYALEKLNKQVTSTKNVLTQAQADYSENLMNAKYTYQDSITAGSTASDNYESTIDKLETDAASTEKIYNNAKKIIETYPDKITVKKNELKTAEKELENVKSQAEEATIKKTELQQQLTSAENSYNQASDSLSKSQETVTYIKNYINTKKIGTDITDMLEDAEQTLALKQTQADAARTEYENVQKKFNTAAEKANQCDKELSKAQSNVTSINNKLTSMKTELSSAKENSEEYKVKYSEAQTALSTGKITAQKTYEADKLAAAAADTEYEAECSSLKSTLDEKQEAYNTAKENLEKFKLCTGDGYIYASQSGTISSLSCEKGRIITDSMSIVGYYELNTLDIAVSVDQSNIADISVGDQVMVMGDSRVSGTVKMIETSRAESSVSDVYYTVTVSVDNTEGKLKLDDSVNVMFGMRNIQESR